MFSLAKASAVVLALTSLAQATITIGQINFKGNSTNTITWTSSDPNNDAETFSVELINQSFHSQFALANNVQTSLGTISFEMPVVASGPNYSLEFVAVGNINQIIAQAGPFSIAENDVSLTTSATKASSSASSGVASTTPIGTLTQTNPSASATGPVTVSSVSSTVGISSTAASGSSSAPTASSSTFSSSGALELIPSGSFAALVASVIALLF